MALNQAWNTKLGQLFIKQCQTKTKIVIKVLSSNFISESVDLCVDLSCEKKETYQMAQFADN